MGIPHQNHRSVSDQTEELDNKELSFLRENRPARRFLYFRFITTYINAQKERYSEVLATIENMCSGHHLAHG
jgi:hypothetical protein